LVLDRGFFTGGGGFPDHYQLKVRKETAIPSRPPSVTYNVSGPNSRINLNSVDRSRNTVTVTAETLFPQLRETVGTLTVAPDVRESLLAAVAAMEAAKGKKSFTARYREFVSAAADHMTVLGPFLPLLSEFLK
jgi:hypothetical protein